MYIHIYKCNVPKSIILKNLQVSIQHRMPAKYIFIVQFCINIRIVTNSNRETLGVKLSAYLQYQPIFLCIIIFGFTHTFTHLFSAIEQLLKSN